MFATLTLLAFGGLALRIPATDAAEAQQNRVVSPEVHADRKVTFRFRAPNAKKVTVGLEGKPNLELAKDDSGIWSGTTGVLEPDIYGYSFNVDGVTALDPLNTEIKVNLVWPGNMVTVPGDPPEVWEVQNVPHGQLHRHLFRSKVVGDDREAIVYTPPGYDPNGSTKYPVLYLLHGYSDQGEGWTKVGKANVILDNLIAQQKAKPMVVVMTLGYGVKLESMFGDGPRIPNVFQRSYEGFREVLYTEVMPMVEKGYRVHTDRNNRAIAGLSMGGAQTLFFGLNAMDKFGAVGAFSTGGFQGAPEGQFPNFEAAKANGLQPLYVACGTGDTLIGFHRTFVKWLDEEGVKSVNKETPGGHTWPVWRRYLAEFAGMLFQ